MPNTIVHKKSSTPGATPSAGSLSAGELAINTADGIVYLKKDDGTVVAAASPEEVLEYTTTASFPATGNSSLLYIATDAGRAYRWVGSQYAEVGPAGGYIFGSVRSDTVGSTSYIGRAAADAATSASVWRIRRTILTAAGVISSTATATNVAWDNRITATYS